MKKKGFVEQYWAYLFVSIPVLLLFIFFYLPLIQGVYYSLTDWSGLARNYNFVGFNNYIDFLTDSRVLNSLRFTAVFTLSLVSGSIIIGLLIAILLNRKIKGIGFLRTIYFFPAVISTITLGLIFNQIFSQGLPQLGAFLGWEWLTNNLLARRQTAVGIVIFVALWQGISIPIVIFLSGLQSVPKDIKEAALIDGANKWQVFKKVEFPFLQTALSMVLILALRNGISAFDLIFSLTAGGPENSTTSLGLLVYNFAFRHNRFGYASALSIITLLLVTIIAAIQIRLSRKNSI